jgi:hypothetical protein
MVTGPWKVFLPVQKLFVPPVFVRAIAPWNSVSLSVGRDGALIPPSETTPPENDARVVVVKVNPFRSRVPAVTFRIAILLSASSWQMLGTASVLTFTVLPGPGIPFGVQFVLVPQSDEVAPFQEKVCATSPNAGKMSKKARIKGSRFIGGIVSVVSGHFVAYAIE